MNCKYLIVEKEPIRMIAYCRIDMSMCPLVRFCPDVNSLVSADIYKKHGCVKENNENDNESDFNNYG